jgi:hypothetical protein
VPGRKQVDTRGRQAALALGGGRMALGAAVLLATRPALKLLGFGATDTTGRALARLAGGRDLGLGLLVLAVRDDAAMLRTVTLAGAVLDTADAASLTLVAGEPETRLAATGGIASATAATLLGVWAWRRLGGV